MKNSKNKKETSSDKKKVYSTNTEDRGSKTLSGSSENRTSGNSNSPKSTGGGQNKRNEKQ